MPQPAVPKGDEENIKSVTKTQFFVRLWLRNRKTSSTVLTVTKAIVWALTGLACVFYASRMAIRWRVFKRFMLDDAFVTLAILILLAVSIVLSVESRATFVQEDVKFFHMKPPPDFEHLADRYVKGQWVDAYLFVSNLDGEKGESLRTSLTISFSVLWHMDSQGILFSILLQPHP